MLTFKPEHFAIAANEGQFALKPARLIEVSYRLKNGTKGSVPMISRTRGGAMERVMAMFEDQIRMCSARVMS